MTSEDFEQAFAEMAARLWARHTESLTFQEVRRGLTALSQQYTQRRVDKSHQALSQRQMGRGKQAAFALGFAPRHLVMVHHIVRHLMEEDASFGRPQWLLDLGCGLGIGSAAWALAMRPAPQPSIWGYDTSEWALGEARFVFESLRLKGQFVRARMENFAIPSCPGPGALVAAYAINELSDSTQQALLSRLIAAHKAGHHILIIEPISRQISPFWQAFQSEFVMHGGSSAQWRLRPNMPDSLALLSRAAGLDHRELTARSLVLPGLKRA